MLAATERRVLENVRDASGIGWNSSQSNQKNIFAVVRSKVKMLGARADVLVFVDAEVE